MNRFEASGNRLPFIKVDELTPEEYAALYARLMRVAYIIMGIVLAIFGCVCCCGCCVIGLRMVTNFKENISAILEKGNEAINEI